MGGAEEAGWFRPEIEGLRALAVSAVVAFHLGLVGFGGGWVGVDVFFVISGFVITRTVLRDRDRATTTGGYRLRTFYAARVRRILPAAVLTFLAILVWISRHYGRLSHIWRAQSRAVALYAGNIYFARNGVPYGSPDSPFQHYWSLAVEEQTYLVWPVVLVGVLRVHPSRRALFGACAALGAATFAWFVTAASAHPLDAFYLMPPRAWELLVGAALAVAEPSVRRLPVRWALPLGWASLGAVAVACVRAATPPAGLVGWVLLAVLASAGLLVAGLVGGRRSVARALAVRPLQSIGRHAYVIYLWHLPVIVALDAQADLPLPRNALAIGIVAALAAATHRFLEQPVRDLGRVHGRPGATLVAGASLTVVAVLAATWATRPLRLYVPTDEDPSTEAAQTVPIGSGLQPGQRALLPADATPSVTPALTPPLDDARRMTLGMAPNAPECVRELLGDRHPAAAAARCPLGAPASGASAPTIVLFGDSHAWHWWAAVDAATRSRGWRLVLLWRGGCSWVDGIGDASCAAWRTQAIGAIKRLDPAAIVLGSLDVSVAASMGQSEYTQRAQRTASQLPDGVPVVVLRDTPHPSYDPTTCLARHLDDVRPCDFRWTDQREAQLDREVRAAAAAIGARYVDTQPWVCDTPRCPLIRGDVLVYRDDNHLSATFARTLAPQVGRVLDRVVPR